MIGVIVQFDYSDDFDAARVAAIALEVRERFDGLPGLRQKVFAIDDQNRCATNIYLWKSEKAAHDFFSDEFIKRATDRYGATPSITFLKIAALVDNG